MSKRREDLRDELEATLRARQELTHHEEDYLAEAFLARMEREFDARMEAKIEARLSARHRGGFARRHGTFIIPTPVAMPALWLCAAVPASFILANLLSPYEWRGTCMVLWILMTAVILAVKVTWTVAERKFTKARESESRQVPSA